MGLENQIFVTDIKGGNTWSYLGVHVKEMLVYACSDGLRVRLPQSWVNLIRLFVRGRTVVLSVDQVN